MVTPTEAAQRLGLSRSTIYELIGSGALRAVRIGRARRIPVAALTDYVDSLIAESAPSPSAVHDDQ